MGLGLGSGLGRVWVCWLEAFRGACVWGWWRREVSSFVAASRVCAGVVHPGLCSGEWSERCRWTGTAAQALGCSWCCPAHAQKAGGGCAHAPRAGGVCAHLTGRARQPRKTAPEDNRHKTTARSQPSQAPPRLGARAGRATGPRAGRPLNGHRRGGAPESPVSGGSSGSRGVERRGVEAARGGAWRSGFARGGAAWGENGVGGGVSAPAVLCAVEP